MGMKQDDILKDAESAPDKRGLEAHREAITLLRDKDYTWREIADFLNERGVQADHTKIFRMFNRPKKKKTTMTKQEIPVPTASDYKRVLSEIELNDGQKAMLEAHFKSHNRAITYTELAEAAGYDGYKTANLHYGNLGKKIGEELNFEFWHHEDGTKFYSSAIGQGSQYTSGHFQLVMHHELAKAISELGMFQA